MYRLPSIVKNNDIQAAISGNCAVACATDSRSLAGKKLRSIFPAMDVAKYLYYCSALAVG
jgi:hypothetical protein